MKTKNASSHGFNKRIFSMLIEKARGERSIRRFAMDCNISYLQLRKLILCMQENPPHAKLIHSLAENSEGRVELEDYLFAAGLCEESDEKDDALTKKEKMLLDRYRGLSAKQQKTVDDFADFLLRYKSR